MDVLEKEQLTRSEALSHWYYLSKYRLLKRWLLSCPELDVSKRRLADVGCGEGLFLEMLATDPFFRSWHLIGVDPAHNSEKRIVNGSISLVSSFPDHEAYDVMLFMDVLEHVSDDVAVLGQAVERLRPGGRIFVTVPAFQALWSSHDNYLGHMRRYTAQKLYQTLSSCRCLKTERIHYFYGAIFFPALIVRLWRRRFKAVTGSDLRPCSRLLNGLLLKALQIEARVASANGIAGLTVVAAARKL
jgi:SAM-dependent methyltransferase